jgi:lipopolysaccharide biosynthesis protein
MGVSFLHWGHAISAWNRRRKETSSYVSRKRYDELAAKYDHLTNAIVTWDNPLLRPTKIKYLKSLDSELSGDVCFFVSYSPTPFLKKHVKNHIEFLQSVGIKVVLIINVDDMSDEAVGAFDLCGLPLCGVLVRENNGYDFGAWSHLYSLLSKELKADRLFLINDSMLGPLSKRLFDELFQKITSSNADFLGLIANAEPIFHLQSFFLVIKKSVLRDERFSTFFTNLWNLPTKSMVIDFYETRLTRLVMQLGYSVEAMYELPEYSNEKSDAVINRIQQLSEINFPYLKVSVINTKDGQKILNSSYS